MFPLHQMAHVGVSPSRDLKLFGREIIFEVLYIPTYVITVPERHRQTTYCGITALCVASRGKNRVQLQIADGVRGGNEGALCIIMPAGAVYIVTPNGVRANFF